MKRWCFRKRCSNVSPSRGEGRLLPFLLLLTLLPTSALAQPPSLFFTPDESRRIEEEVRKSPGGDETGLIRVGAILYYGPENWSVWLQGERWTPGTARPGLLVREVTPDAIHLTLTPPLTDTPQDVTLKPWQSYDPAGAGQNTGGDGSERLWSR